MITKVHAGIMFEMAIKGRDLPSLAAVEAAIVETLKDADMELEIVPGELTKEEDMLVEKLLKQLYDEKGEKDDA
jgi:hypothetical protein